MLIIVESSNLDEEFMKEIDERVDYMDWYNTHHPWSYRITKYVGPDKLQHGLAKKAYEMDLEKQNQRVEPNIIPHPLYVELQM